MSTVVRSVLVLFTLFFPVHSFAMDRDRSICSPGAARGRPVRVYFDFNEALPFPGQDGAFYQVLSCLRAFGALGVEVAGFADQNECDVVEETGSCLPDRDFHQALGARRADSLKRRLVGNGISASRITLLSFGSDRPAEPGPHEPGKVEAKDEANESLNRRVELRFY